MRQALLCAAANSAPPRVLIADDCELSRGLLRRLLMRRGYFVDEAANGAAALDTVEKFEPDIVLLDLRLPDIDGSEVLRQLRRSHDSIALPIIMISAEHDGEIIAACLSLGADDFVPKPMHWATLRVRVETHLERSMAQAQVAAMRAQLSLLASVRAEGVE